MKKEDYAKFLWDELRPKYDVVPWWVDTACNALMTGEGWIKYIADPHTDNLYLIRHWLTPPHGVGSDGAPSAANCLVLHHFVEADPDRYLHNHPYSITAQVLEGYYVEERWDPVNKVSLLDTKRPNSVNLIQPDTYHRVERIMMSEESGGVWTLSHMGPKVQEWGFLVDGEHIHHEKYLCSLT